ncbi:hypothetical protein Halha_0748 [Halobacteroides halobius DSM 5150]|uniref:Uncharacterized protein n=1 Tax=Halobacteroides halobius (strain ATCC 35273 / DSM 5150 / MD-1) TaxID=748449 RepID=L0K6R7_HALHC|nr:hypothetical protein [Halobacteroides halobius]AGB40721.1 hypothetical protein Halha_0748 [Halobacteroides halobius DSM 5150]
MLEWKKRREEKQSLETQFIEEISWLPIISFIFGTITVGFLKAIGSQIWAGLKKYFSQAEEKKEMPSFEIQFSYKGVKIIAKFNNNDRKKIKDALKNLDGLLKSIPHKQNLNQITFVLDSTGDWKQQDSY